MKSNKGNKKIKKTINYLVKDININRTMILKVFLHRHFRTTEENLRIIKQQLSVQVLTPNVTKSTLWCSIYVVKAPSSPRGASGSPPCSGADNGREGRHRHRATKANICVMHISQQISKGVGRDKVE